MNVKHIGKESIHNICASQVIFTLGSVVKELVENSIDANASDISIRLQENGIKLIEVSDNGKGIKKMNFDNVCARHATSKIGEFNDIQNKLQTLGFRGEALNSLCSLSDVEIRTRNEECEHGYLLKYDKLGNLVHEEPIARVQGSTVSCYNIFKNIPIRKKDFEKNIKNHLSEFLSLIQQYAIIYHHIKFSVYNITTKGGTQKNSTLLMTQGSSSWKDNFFSIFGKKNIGNLLDLNIETELWQMKGFISDSSSGRKDKGLQFYYINSRPIHILKNVNKLINNIYREFSSRLYPVLVVNIISDIKNIDVNVTPDKREVFLTFENDMCEEIKTELVKLLTPHSSSMVNTRIDHYFLKANNLVDPKDSIVPDSSLEKEWDMIQTNQLIANEEEVSNEGNYRNLDDCSLLLPIKKECNNEVSPIVNNEHEGITKEEIEFIENIYMNHTSEDTDSKSKFTSNSLNSVKTESYMNMSNKFPLNEKHSFYCDVQSESPSQNFTKVKEEETEEHNFMKEEETEKVNININHIKMNERKGYEYATEIRKETNAYHNKNYNEENINDSVYEYKLEDIKNDNTYEYKIEQMKQNNAYEYKVKENNQNKAYEYQLDEIKQNNNAYEHKVEEIKQNNAYEYKLDEIKQNNVYEYKLDETKNNSVYEYKLENIKNDNIYEYKLENINANAYEYQIELTTTDEKLDSNENAEYSFEELKEEIKNACIKTLPVDINMYINREPLEEGYDYDLLHIINLTHSKKVQENVFHKIEDEKEDSNQIERLCLTDAEETTDYTNLFGNELSISEVGKSQPANAGNNEDIDFNTIDENKKDLYFKSNLFEKLKICGQFNKGFIISKIDLQYFKNRNEINNTDPTRKRQEGDREFALFIIDQHAADEKSNFEKYNKSFCMKSQKLINRINLHLSPSQIQVIEKNVEIFEENGFEVQITEEEIQKKRKLSHSTERISETSNMELEKKSSTDNNDFVSCEIQEGHGSSFDDWENKNWTETKVSILSLPVFNGKLFEVTDFMSLLYHLIEHPISYSKESFEQYRRNKNLPNSKTDTWFNYNFPRPQKVWRILASKACRTAVMVGTQLNFTEMIRIKKKLSVLKNPWNCPHGRPTIKYIVNNIDIINCFKQYYVKLYDELQNLLVTENYDMYKYLFHNHPFFLLMSSKPMLGPILKF